MFISLVLDKGPSGLKTLADVLIKFKLSIIIIKVISRINFCEKKSIFLYLLNCQAKEGWILWGNWGPDFLLNIPTVSQHKCLQLKAFQLQENQTDVGRCRFDTPGKLTPALWAGVNFPTGITLGQCSPPHMAETSALVTETLV